MSGDSSVTIACASAFWGDTPYAVRQILREPKLDYIVFDYLSEVTMTLLARQKKRDPAMGYTADFFSDVIVPHLAQIKDRKIRLVSNAGGCNPGALKAKIEEFAQANSLAIRIAVVEGDDLVANGRMPQKFVDIDGVRHDAPPVITANAYLGAPAVVAALETDADIVLTGRIVDTALVLGPLVHEFKWRWDQYDLLAQGSLAGHIVECGTQCTGGNFTDWATVPGRDNVGFPIVRFESNGGFVVTKAPRSGGMVTTPTVAEQVVYEIADPKNYLLPDVICDFSQVLLKEVAPDVVQVSGAKGRAPSGFYKVLATVQEGWKISTTAFIQGGDARAKALSTGEAILQRCERLLFELGHSAYSETRLEVLGGGDQVVLRLSAAHSHPEPLEIMAKEIAPAATSLAPGMAGLLSGRASATPRIAVVSFLIEKKSLEISVVGTDQQKRSVVNIPTSSLSESKLDHRVIRPSISEPSREVPLIRIAYARSGDKGDDVNIGVIARHASLFGVLQSELTNEKVAAFFTDDFSSPSPTVTSWELPGLSAINFLLFKCLGGGGAFSLKADPQGKAFAQRLLMMPIRVPERLLGDL